MNRRALLSALPMVLAAQKIGFAESAGSIFLSNSDRGENESAPPPAASSRLDISAIVEARADAQDLSVLKFIFSQDEAAKPPGFAHILNSYLLKAHQPEQGWLLLGDKGIVAPQDYKAGTAIDGFAVTIGIVPIDDDCKPVGKPRPFQVTDLLDKKVWSGKLDRMFKGAPNSRCRAITFWVTDHGTGQVQSENKPDQDAWTNFLRLGTKSPPVALLKGCEMEKPHLLALVYEFEKKPTETAWSFKSPGDEVEKHLKASGLWTPLGLD